MPYTELVTLPIVTFWAILEGWRDEDNELHKRNIRGQYIAKNSADGKELEQEMENLWP